MKEQSALLEAMRLSGSMGVQLCVVIQLYVLCV